MEYYISMARLHFVAEGWTPSYYAMQLQLFIPCLVGVTFLSLCRMRLSVCAEQTPCQYHVGKYDFELTAYVYTKPDWRFSCILACIRQRSSSVQYSAHLLLALILFILSFSN